MVHTCASFAAELRYFPPGQVFSVQAEKSVSMEYLPEEHGTHDVSVDAVPATDPKPSAHVSWNGLEWDLHAVLSVSSLYWPTPHAGQDALSEVATPST